MVKFVTSPGLQHSILERKFKSMVSCICNCKITGCCLVSLSSCLKIIVLESYACVIRKVIRVSESVQMLWKENYKSSKIGSKSKFFIHQLMHKWSALKTILKFTLKQLLHVSVQSHHHQGAHYSCLLKLQLLK